MKIMSNVVLISQNDNEFICKGTDGVTKTDEFSEKLQTAFDPPPSFSENHIVDFSRIHDQITVSNGKNLFLNWNPPSLELFQN